MATVAPSDTLVQALVVANHILYDQGVVDGLGHVSVRHDRAPNHFLLSCNRAPALVREDDVQCHGPDGEVVSEDPRPSYLERYIHSAIYRARPDVSAVVHCHSPSVIPLGVTGRRLRPVFHMAGFLGSGAAHYDQRRQSGDTDLLIRSPALGEALALALGGCSCVLMRGHGATVVGASLAQVVYRAIYAEVNARLMIQAGQLGEIDYLTPVEADLAAAANDTQLQRSWDLWARRARSSTVR